MELHATLAVAHYPLPPQPASPLTFVPSISLVCVQLQVALLLGMGIPCASMESGV